MMKNKKELFLKLGSVILVSSLLVGCGNSNSDMKRIDKELNELKAKYHDTKDVEKSEPVETKEKESKDVKSDKKETENKEVKDENKENEDKDSRLPDLRPAGANE